MTLNLARVLMYKYCTSVRIFTATYPLGKCLATLEGDTTLSAKVRLVLKHFVIVHGCLGSCFPQSMQPYVCSILCEYYHSSLHVCVSKSVWYPVQVLRCVRHFPVDAMKLTLSSAQQQRRRSVRVTVYTCFTTLSPGSVPSFSINVAH